MSEPLLSMRGLAAGWTQPVVGPVDLEIQPGEAVGVAGPNGAGKSTLLAAITGRARVFSGSLQLRPALNMGLQTQHLPPLEGLPVSGRDLLRLTQRDPEGLPTWLAGCLDVRLDQLSGGQRQYLALWAVLKPDCDLLLLDEPTNNLDAAGTRHLTATLRAMADRGSSALVVSHDLAFLEASCHRMITVEARP